MPVRFQPDAAEPEGEYFKNHRACLLNRCSKNLSQHVALSIVSVDYFSDAIAWSFVLVAFEHDGLISYDARTTPLTPEEWELPAFLMSTHDGSVVSWRSMM